MTEEGLSERLALAVTRMSASSLRYTPAPDRNQALRTRTVALAHRHRRYGAWMIYLKLRQAVERVNHERVARLDIEAGLQVRQRRRKKIPAANRQPLVRPAVPNDVGSAYFVFDRTAEGRIVKCLTIVDDATTEEVTIVPDRALCGSTVTRVLDRLAPDRCLPRILHADNDPEFCGRAMLTWAQPPAPDRAWQTDAERVHRIGQWAVSRRVSQRALIHQHDPRQGPHRGVAS